MLHASIQVVLYGLVAGLSAVGFAATLAVMPSGRLKAFGFGAGFVRAQILTCSVLVIFGIAVTGSSASHPDLRAELELALALVLGRLRVLTTVAAGFVLGIGGPKRLVLTCLAAATIVTAGLGDADQTALVAVYVTLATALVWGPWSCSCSSESASSPSWRARRAMSLADSRRSPSTRS